METVVLTESSHLLSILLQNQFSCRVIGFMLLLILLLASAMAAGSEVAFFSLSAFDKETLNSNKSSRAKAGLKLLENPERLLATLLITKNFLNISIVILSAYLTDNLFVSSSISPSSVFLFKVFIITFLILIFGEIVPKVYASRNGQQIILFMSHLIFILCKFFTPISYILIHSTSIVKQRFAGKKPEISMEDLSNALELTNNSTKDSKKILKGIVSYGNTNASEIMKSRVDIVAFSIFTPFTELLEKIKKQNYSRIPIFAETFDNIKGVLFVKDLLPHFHKQTFNWQSLIRPAYFVPESKKINDLLLDFQTKKIHMAFVIDEYGGTNGIVTLEDVLEEIVGEIVDEFDYDDEFYKKLDEKTYVFEGKTLINDFYKIMKIEDDFFEDIRGDADTLAGLILEIQGEIPKVGSIIEFQNYIFKILAADKRRIKQIHVTLQNSINDKMISHDK